MPYFLALSHAEGDAEFYSGMAKIVQDVEKSELVLSLGELVVGVYPYKD